MIDPQDYRSTYDAYVADFKASARTASDELLLRIRLQKLGYVGTRLSEEIRYIRGLSS